MGPPTFYADELEAAPVEGQSWDSMAQDSPPKKAKKISSEENLMIKIREELSDLAGTFRANLDENGCDRPKKFQGIQHRLAGDCRLELHLP